MSPERRTGRRPGNQPTRATILAAARARFAAQGYSGTTIRAVAADAGVDPALVVHYFGSKSQLFAASVELRVDPESLVAGLLDRPLDELGEALLRTILAITAAPGTRDAWVGMIRSAVAEGGEGAAVLREFVSSVVLGPLGERLALEGMTDAPLRTTLVASQVVGLAIARHVLQVDPLASTPDEVLVPAVAPTLQRYLTGDIRAWAPAGSPSSPDEAPAGSPSSPDEAPAG